MKILRKIYRFCIFLPFGVVPYLVGHVFGIAKYAFLAGVDSGGKFYDEDSL